MFMIYPCTRCHIPCSSGLLVVSADREPYGRHIVYTEFTLPDVASTYVHPHYFNTLRGSSVDRNSEVRTAMLVFCTLGN